MRTFGIQLDLIVFRINPGIVLATGTNSKHSFNFSADIFVSQLKQRGFSVLIRDPQL